MNVSNRQSCSCSIFEYLQALLSWQNVAAVKHVHVERYRQHVPFSIDPIALHTYKTMHTMDHHFYNRNRMTYIFSHYRRMSVRSRCCRRTRYLPTMNSDVSIMICCMLSFINMSNEIEKTMG
jgi:hypothetical protein